MENRQTLEHATLLLLKLLQSGDMYGYQMITELERRSDSTFHMKEGTLYPILKKLENEDCVRSYAQEADGRTRKYYRLTDKGLARLARETAQWQAYERGIDRVLGGALAPAGA